jgi:hypothetical protein
MEAEPEKLSPPGKAGSQAYGDGAREAEPAGKGWKPMPTEVEPEKLSPPGKAGAVFIFALFLLLHPFQN